MLSETKHLTLKLKSGNPKLKIGFTLLELLLVIAIIAVLAGLVLYALNPAQRLNDATEVQQLSKTNDIEKAINAYVVEHAGVFPFTTTNLTQTAYTICAQGQTLNCGINLDTLVTTGYMSSIPTNAGASGNNTGFMLKYTPSVVKVGTSTITCPIGYIGVPGNPLYQTEDFCVMKYEAKNVSSVATSQAALTPWVSITQTAAITACSNLGSNYHLITNNEWMTIARNIEQVASNWTTNTVGTEAVYSGHNDNVPPNSLAANADDAQGYDGTGQTTPANQRRTHTLSNGQVIWDLAGNVWEWNSNVISCAAAACTSAEMPYDVSPAEEWVEFTNLVSYGQLSYDLIRPSNVTWNATQGFGRIYTDANAAAPSGNVHAFLRGGYWYNTSSAGALALYLDLAPADAGTGIGFRCAASL